MEFASFLDRIDQQASALRAAAVAAGPEAPVLTCPKWTVDRLVRHVARVHSWVVDALESPPGAAEPTGERPPDGWDPLLAWWDDVVATMVSRMRTGGPAAPAWVFDNAAASTAVFWARRQAHETAIHRLDAEHAAAGSLTETAVPSLVFDPELAADGIDEVLTMFVPGRVAHEQPDLEGTVLFHAADAGRAWHVQLKPGAFPEVGPAAEVDADASVVGTADAVYRAAWHRPSTAIVTGDRSLVAALRSP